MELTPPLFLGPINALPLLIVASREAVAVRLTAADVAYLRLPRRQGTVQFRRSQSGFAAAVDQGPIIRGAHRGAPLLLSNPRYHNRSFFSSYHPFFPHIRPHSGKLRRFCVLCGPPGAFFCNNPVASEP